MKRLSPFLLLVALGPACHYHYLTRYEPLCPSGGYYEIPSAEGRTLVVIAANGSRMGPVLDSWLLFRAAQVTKEEGHTHFRVIEKRDEPPDANEYGSYRIALIEFLDGPGPGEVYDAARIKERTRDHLKGPKRYQD